MSELVTKKQALDLLIGKTIKSVDTDSQFGWFCIYTITFDDGTVLELDGDAGRAKIDGIVKPDGDRLYIDDELYAHNKKVVG